VNRTFSIYLDALRFGAAIAVLLYHAALPKFGGTWLHMGNAGPDAVMVFFVLSGFVIAYTAEHKDTSLGTYAASRLARLWSVLLPALLLTFAADMLGAAWSPELYAGEDFRFGLPSLLTSALFGNELWFSSIKPMSNEPVWSLGFEFWYYVIFGASFYLRGALRAGVVSATCLIVGPKILLFFPLWLAGAILYWSSRRISPPLWLGWLLAVAPVAAYGLAEWNDLFRTLDWRSRVYSHDMDMVHTANFLWYYFVGGLVTLHLAGMATIAPKLAGLLRPLERPIRGAAGYTLSIYLFHAPLLLCMAAYLHPSPLVVSHRVV
jgi:peptidoglycan/LPS O-acetylase OafA/YrhL